MSDTDDKVIDTLNAIANLRLTGSADQARSAMDAIKFVPIEKKALQGVSKPQTATVFRRDAFACCYCGIRTVPSIVLRVFSALYPTEFPYHPHGKSSAAHPAYWTIMASVDHVVPRASGGRSSLENLATTCWPCNQVKSNLSLDRLGWTLRPPGDPHWDGLTGVYPRLWALAGKPDVKVHKPWLSAFA